MKSVRSIVAGLLIAGLGCADLSKAPLPCFDETQCVAGQQCVLGECTWIPNLTLEVDVTPAAPSGYLYQPFSGIDATQPDSLKLVVPRPLTASVTLPKDAPAARVSFESDSGLRRPIHETVDVRPGQEAMLSLVRGTLDVATGAIDRASYTLVAIPLDSGCCVGTAPCTAPVVERNVQPSADFPLQPGFPTKVTRITGVVLVSEEDWTPVAGLQVQVVDPTTGSFSLPDVTDERGYFCVAIAAPERGVASLTLRLGPAENRPTVEVAGLTVGPDDLEIDLGNLTLGAHGTPIVLSGSRVVTADGEPVAGAQVLFQGQVDPKGTYRASVVTDDSGHFEVALLRGTYQVRIVPAAGEAAGALETEVTVEGPLRSPLEFVLPQRPTVSGVVTDQDGLPVESALVIAEPQGTGRLDVPGLHTVATTDTSGTYVLRLDPGAYRIHVRAPAMSDLAWSVGHALDVMPLDQSLDPIVLPPAVEVEGRVLGAQEMRETLPLGGAKVEVYGRSPSGTALLLWETRADEDGRFAVAIPPELTADP